MSTKHEISCWKCHEMTSLETRNEMDGCCWACGEEIDLDDYLIKAMDKRDEHYAALSAVTAERDRLLEEVTEMDALRDKLSGLLSKTAVALRGPEPELTRYGYADIPLRVKTVIDERDQLRAEAEALRKAFMRMRNVAAGYSNCCEFDSANTRRLEREFEAADELFRSSAAMAAKDA